MRRILDLHQSLACELQSSGDALGARAARHAGERLREAILDRYAPPAELLTVDATWREGERGRELRVHGANDVTSDLTLLPGQTARPDWSFHAPGEIAHALGAQSDLLEELLAEPEVARAFPDRRIDLHDTGHRRTVWNAMFRAYRREAGADALTQLMSLIGRYLRAFTFHTEYNVREWGVSYLDSERPTDLVGRVAADCGVYAVTVAYEVYRAARDASPRLDLRFEIVAATEHVMLVIHDGDRMFLVNNDEVTGPHTDTRAIGEALSRVRRVANLVTPVSVSGAGSAAMGDRAFRQQLWQGFQDASSWYLAPEPAGPGDGRSERERRDSAYERMYREQQWFSDEATRLAILLDQLDRDLAASPPARRGDVIRDALAIMRDVYVPLVALLLRYSEEAIDRRRGRFLIEAERPQAEQRLQFDYVVGFTAGARHPLARVDERMAQLEELGRRSDLTPADLEFRARIARVPLLTRP
jgi:hypothetical protein